MPRSQKISIPEASPEILYFEDDGSIPNSYLPVLVYRQIFNKCEKNYAESIQYLFAQNGWTRAWRDGIYEFHHYHSITHEVLGVASGSALLHLGGDAGQTFAFSSGDVLVIPAGVGHKCVERTTDFEVVGAYPHSASWDVLCGLDGERPCADNNIASVPLPALDPVYGSNGPMRRLWIKAICKT